MKHSSTQALLRYWNALRGDRSAPERNDVDPTEIRSVLIDTFILDVDRTGACDLRLVGDRTNCLFLKELKGTSFWDLWAEEDREDLDLLLSTVLDEAMPVVAGARAAAYGRKPVDLELLILPLRHNGRTHSRMLGCLAPHSIPSWFGLLPTSPLGLGSMRALHPERCLDEAAHEWPENPMPPDLYEPFEGQLATRRGHLLVIDGDR